MLGLIGALVLSLVASTSGAAAVACPWRAEADHGQSACCEGETLLVPGLRTSATAVRSRTGRVPEAAGAVRRRPGLLRGGALVHEAGARSAPCRSLLAQRTALVR